MKKARPYFSMLLAMAMVVSSSAQNNKFISVKGKDIIGIDGKPMMLKGTNLGNWLVPEGYMLKFKNTNSPGMIAETFAQLVGPDAAATFWAKYLDSYITEKDIHFLKSIGVNSIRIPFNYRLFTSEDYLGANDSTRGFALLDRVINWCKKENVYVILDMHCAPGGQTGDNIDDSYGYPFLFQSASCQNRTIDIWCRIAKKYSKETIIIGYDLLNEPVAHYFDANQLNPFIEPFYKSLVKEMRKVDKNHIMFLGGAQWNTNFKIFGEPFDPKLVYTFHKYGDQPNLGSIQRFIDFREKYNVPIYIGETGENTDEWVGSFRKLLDEHNIGWHFWPYKKMESPKNIISVNMPNYYDSLIQYAEASRSTYKDIRKLAPKNRDEIQKALDGLLSNCRFEMCKPNIGYIRALGFDIKEEKVEVDKAK